MHLKRTMRVSHRTAGVFVAAALVTTLAAGTVAIASMTRHADAAPTLSFTGPSLLSASTSTPLTNGVVTADLGNGRQDILEPTNDASGTILIYWNNGDGTYSDQTLTGLGTEVMTVAVGDFNGDGKPDIAYAGTASGGSVNEVAILFGRGQDMTGKGTFTSPDPTATYPLAAQPVSMATGDFNGHTDLAVVTGNGSGGNVTVLLNDGTGAFTPLVLTPNFAMDGGPNTNGQPISQSLAVGDLTGYKDGLQSIVTTDSSGLFSVYLNTDDTSTPASIFKADRAYLNGAGITGYAVTLAHLNGKNSLLDIVASGTNDTSGAAGVWVYYNQGDGTFAQGNTQQIGSNYEPLWLAAADFNGDGYSDLAISDIEPALTQNGGKPFIEVVPGMLDTSGTSATRGATVFDYNAATILQTQNVTATATVDQAGPITTAVLTNSGLPDIVADTFVTLSGGATKTFPTEIFTNTSPAPTPGPAVTSKITGGETINGTTYVTSSSVITLTANNASAISYRYYENSLGTPTSFDSGSAPSIARVGGAIDAIPHGLGNFFLPYTTVGCTTTTTCTTSTSINGTTSTVLTASGMLAQAQTPNHIGFATRNAAGAHTTGASTQIDSARLITGTPYTIQFYATGTNGTGSPATAQSIQVVLVSSLPATTGLSGHGSTSSPATASSPRSPSTAKGSTTGSASQAPQAPTTQQQTTQQQQQQQQQAPAVASQPFRLALVLAVLVALVLFSLGSSLALAYFRRRAK